MKKLLLLFVAAAMAVACKKDDVHIDAERPKNLAVTITGDVGSQFSFRVWKCYDPDHFDTLATPVKVISGITTQPMNTMHIDMVGPEFFYVVGYRLLQPYEDSVYYNNASGSGYYHFMVDHGIYIINRTISSGVAVPATVY